ncbi:VOC family protein [Bacillus sp. KH172YL63]|uniref:VOC family protein n=1 Tax=Bacillus sp. KH172YL63 TaxID=2709784 RepID=UPI0013E4C65A|nr:VOC family protein [Bacillus sp. KH172YL63]BCB02557.1 hypothetical protein KH172YL63_06900 [Bacillus sp. KH172YL63]
MKLTHTRLLVDDYKACFIFYRDVLGFEVSWGDESSLYGQFKTGDTQLGIFERKQMADALGVEDRSDGERDSVALVFEVENVEKSYTELKEKVSFITEPVERGDWGIKVAHFRDPAGNLIEIYESI